MAVNFRHGRTYCHDQLAGPDNGRELAFIVGERLAACVNILAPCASGFISGR